MGEMAGKYEELLKKRGDILEGHDPGRLKKICEHVIDKWSVAPELKYYTLHDHRHSARVEEKLYELLPDEQFKKLTPEERFLLLASAWLHDIGMIRDIPFVDEDKKLTEIVVRKTHHERAERYINSNKVWPGLSLNAEETAPLGIICRYHRKSEDLRKCEEKIPAPGVGEIRTSLLAAYLRLADALRIADLTGVPEKEFRTNLIMGMDPESTFHWLKSKYALGISLTKEPFTITIFLKRPKDSDENVEPLGKFLCEEIQEELDSSMDTLRKGGLAFYQSVNYKTIEVPFSSDEIEGLRWVLGQIETRITTSAGMAINSVLNNIQLILRLEKARVIEELLNYEKIILVPFLKERPCHVYLTKIKEMLDENLENIQDPNKLEDVERDRIIRSIDDKIDKWRDERKKAFKAFPIMSKPFFIDGSPVLLYGYSSSVVESLGSLPDNIKEGMGVYICECKTKNRYGYNNRLLYCDGIHYANEIRKVGFKKIYLVADSCASNLFSWRDEEIKISKESFMTYEDSNEHENAFSYQRRISKVLFGANGIGENGEISHGLGHLAIADMAKTYNIPVYVIAETMKIIKKINKSPGLPRDVKWLTTDLSINLDACQLYNPREDIVPPEKITMIITEKGAFQPWLVEQICKIHKIDIDY